LEEFNEKTANRNEQLGKQVAYLESRYYKGSVQVSVLENKKNEINALIRDANKRKDRMHKELAALNEDQRSISKTQDLEKVAKLSQEINILKKNIAMLDKNNKQMAQLVSSLTLRK
jgi:chromosome segregation ATPase